MKKLFCCEKPNTVLLFAPIEGGELSLTSDPLLNRVHVVHSFHVGQKVLCGDAALLALIKVHQNSAHQLIVLQLSIVDEAVD